jgi:CBS domain-containing protein
MKVKDVMTRDVKTCRIDDDISNAAREMWMRNCGVLPIVDDRQQVIGVLTDRDICIAAGSKNREPSRITVREVMTHRLYSCAPEADIREALQIMREKRVRRLPVLNADGKLCGILSLDDVALKAREAAKPGELSAEDVEITLEAICRRCPPQKEASVQRLPEPVF